MSADLERLPEQLRALAEQIDGVTKSSRIQRLEEAQQRGVDMETALAYMLLPRARQRSEQVRTILAKWRGKTSLNWDWYWNPKDRNHE